MRGFERGLKATLLGKFAAHGAVAVAFLTLLSETSPLHVPPSVTALSPGKFPSVPGLFIFTDGFDHSPQADPPRGAFSANPVGCMISYARLAVEAPVGLNGSA